MKQIHNSKERKPPILTEDLAWERLFGDLSEDRITETAKYQFPANEMEVYTLPKDFREALDPTKPCIYSEADLPPIELAGSVSV